MIFSPVIRRSTYVSAPRQLDAFFERWLGDAVAANASTCKPQASQDDKAVTLSLDVPGVTKEQLNIAIEAKVLRVQTVADAPRRYQWVYELPQDIDASSSEAKLELGVLTLKLTKLQPASKATQISID